jgi:pimeloyl-ACP methyl ester carboxylesterase
MRIRRLIKHASLFAGAAATIALMSGATFERLSRERASREFRAQGLLVRVGEGRRIQIDCRGSGSPTVVLESGLDTYGSLSWASVHDLLATRRRVCAYSRAGILWSDPSAAAFDSRAAMTELHAVLIAAGATAPWVMVGHSLGGPYIMTFTQLYPAEVAGLVLVDASHPDQFAKFAAAVGKSIMPSPTVPRIGAAIAWTGVVRLLPTAPPPVSWPQQLANIAPAFLPTSVAALAKEVRAIPSTLARAGAARALGDRPLVVLSAGKAHTEEELKAQGMTAADAAPLFAAHLALAADMATWSTRGRLAIVADASHYIQLDRPDVVVAAVDEVSCYLAEHDTDPRCRRFRGVGRRVHADR